MTITQVGIVSIPVNDQDRAKTFYADILDFEVVRDNPMGPHTRWIQLRPPGAATSIVLTTWLDAMPAGSATHLLETDDVDADRAALAAKGAEIGEVKEEPWGRYAILKDPDGNNWVFQTNSETVSD